MNKRLGTFGAWGIWVAQNKGSFLLTPHGKDSCLVGNADLTCISDMIVSANKVPNTDAKQKSVLW